MLQINAIHEGDKGLLVDIIIQPKDLPLKLRLNNLFVGYEGKVDKQPYIMPATLKHEKYDDRPAAFICDDLGMVDRDAMRQLAKAVLAEHKRRKKAASTSLAALF